MLTSIFVVIISQFVSQIILCTLNIHMLYVNNISIKLQKKFKFKNLKNHLVILLGHNIFSHKGVWSRIVLYTNTGFSINTTISIWGLGFIFLTAKIAVIIKYICKVCNARIKTEQFSLIYLIVSATDIIWIIVCYDYSLQFSKCVFRYNTCLFHVWKRYVCFLLFFVTYKL